MNGPSTRRRRRASAQPAPREEALVSDEADGYAWNYYGRDTLPADQDPYSVRPPPRARRSAPDEERNR